MPPNYPATVPEFTHSPTSDPRIFRFCDRYGDWTHYLYKEKPDERGKYYAAVNHILRNGFPKDDRFNQYLLRSDETESKEKLKVAGNRGTRVHNAIKEIIDGETVSMYKPYPDEVTGGNRTLDPDEWDRLLAFKRFAERYQLKRLIYERPVVSHDYAYAGTPDFLGVIVVPGDERTSALKDRKGETLYILLDWKTSAAIYDEYKLQTAAYREAALDYWKEEIPVKGKEYWTGVVRLGARSKEGYEFQAWTPEQTNEHFDRFFDAKNLYHFVKGGSYDPTIEEIPTMISVQVPGIEVRKRKKTTKTITEPQ
jgi:hypothetical protein